MKSIIKPLWKPPLLNEWADPLIQELYWPNRWRMIMTCLCLSRTSGKQVRPILPQLFVQWPDAFSMSTAKEETLYSLIRPLGFANKRVKTFKRFSAEYLEKDWKEIKDLYGCGQYAQDSDDIFFMGRWRHTYPSDGELKRYLDFVRGNLS